MDRIDFSQSGGFPLDQDVFGFQQNNTFMLSQLAALGGARYIVSGCVEVGNNVSNGYIVIDGEVLPFAGGAKQEKVVIIEQKVPLRYQDGVDREVQISRYAQFGNNGITDILWSGLKRNPLGVLARLEAAEAKFADIDRLKVMAAPFLSGGGMVLWNRPAADIPVGWREVTDWQGRLPLGAITGHATYGVGKTGGSFSKTLIGDNIPEHYHYTVVNESVNTNSFPGQVGRTISAIKAMVREWIKGGGSGGESYVMYGQSGSFPTQQPTIGPTSKSGKANPDAIDITNPFRTVYFIEPIPQN